MAAQYDLDEWYALIGGKAVAVADMTKEQLQQELCHMFEVLERVEAQTDNIRTILEEWRGSTQ